MDFDMDLDINLGVVDGIKWATFKPAQTGRKAGLARPIK
jgi:hypothetical protein